MKLRIRYKKMKQENERLKKQIRMDYRKNVPGITENAVNVIKVTAVQRNFFPDIQDGWLKYGIVHRMMREIVPLVEFDTYYDEQGKKAMKGTLEVLQHSEEEKTNVG